MYRYQQRQWLQRQQMNEEEERERLRNMKTMSDVPLEPEVRSTLEAKYQQQQPARLLFPTNYHLQQTTGGAAADASSANAEQHLQPQQPQQQPQTSPLIKQESDSLGGLLDERSISDPFMMQVQGNISAEFLDAHNPLNENMDIAMSPSPSVDMTYSPGLAQDPLTFLDLEPVQQQQVQQQQQQQFQQQQLLQQHHQQHQQQQQQQMDGHASAPAYGNYGMVAPMAVQGRPQSGHGAVPIPVSAPGVVPADWVGSASVGSGTVPNFVAPSGNYQFHFSSSVPTTFKEEHKSPDPDAWAAEKRRRRRESHNAVERRRRDNINDRITELSLLVPDCVDEVNPSSKPNKGIILRKSADYIRYLQEANRRLQKQVVSSNGGQMPDTLTSELDVLSHKFLDNDSGDLGDSDGGD